MALTPLDLQTLFVKMNDVNREQAHQKAAAAQEQAFEAKTLVEKEKIKDNSVNKTADENEMDNRIKDEQNAREQKEGEAGEKRDGEKDEEEDKKEYIKDPNLGQNIDIIG